MTLAEAEARIKKAMEHVTHTCGGCKQCDPSCAAFTLQKILRGEPTEECRYCSEYVEKVGPHGCCDVCEPMAARDDAEIAKRRAADKVTASKERAANDGNR